jgi:lipopolysaccharide export LptBFGC system permease protein LptF
MKTGKESDKELAKQYKARKFYIVKVIDRDHEDEGVKFWRFKHNYKQDGVLDKIIPIWRSKGNITDVNEGRDLIIQLVKSKTPKGKEYTTIQTIMHDDPSALSADKAQLEEWKNDTTTWEDVYSKKPVEYLEAIARGEVPRWDSEAKKYVYGDEASESFGGKANYSDPQAGMDADEELPF